MVLFGEPCSPSVSCLCMICPKIMSWFDNPSKDLLQHGQIAIYTFLSIDGYT
jgi:hypothetical protein